MSKLSDIGLIGLAVMGENLALNLENKGYRVSVYNRTVKGTEEGIVENFMNGRGKNRNFTGTSDLKSFADSIKKPRKIIMMVKAGNAVDELLSRLSPLLDKGDIIIDGGNTHFPDTSRRTRQMEDQGFLYIGTGISGGEEGALKGPSIMPGGSEKAWPTVKPILQSIAAKVDGGTPCCDWVGDGGAGHFLKMVHNGIEYGDMQIICEAYHLMKDLLSMSADEMHNVFAEWNKGDLNSYLIEITGEILGYREDGEPLVDKILDTAGQKGTGKWTVITALDTGIPLTMIGEAVFARFLSALKNERVTASKIYKGPVKEYTGEKAVFIENIRQALLASKIISYTQGFMLMREAAREYKWKLDYGSIATMWRGGCIIRSVFLSKIKEAWDADPELTNLLLAPYFRNMIEQSQQGWRKVVGTAVANGIPVPAMASALTWFDAYRSAKLPANLLQAQRDYFGAHTYERTDKPAGEFFHTNWTGKGGTTSSSTYNA